jgi:hypothetical protein
MQQMQLSARAYHRIFKLARAIADLAGQQIFKRPTSLRRFSTGLGSRCDSIGDFFRLAFTAPPKRLNG